MLENVQGEHEIDLSCQICSRFQGSVTNIFQLGWWSGVEIGSDHDRAGQQSCELPRKQAAATAEIHDPVRPAADLLQQHAGLAAKGDPLDGARQPAARLLEILARAIFV